MTRLYLISFLLLVATVSWSQQRNTSATFKDYRIINTHSVETLGKRKLDIRIGHRFGDIKGGWNTFFGLEQAEDVMIGAALGITDKFTVGLHRTKGAGPLTKLINGTLKYRLIRQSDESEKTPLSVTILGIGSITTMGNSNDPEALNNFDNFSHRFLYTLQFLVARKFSDRFSLQVIPSYTHRNLVAFNDINSLFSIGVATRIQLTKMLGLIADATFPFSDLRIAGSDYFPPMGLGLEIDTGGHIFQVNFTNATGIIETDYIPNTRSSWGDGEFRLGFTISRLFNL